MGMYDSIYFTCPKCGEAIEEQSKAGECELSSYSQNAVPMNIALDIVGQNLYCEKCNESYTILSDELPPTTVKMKLV